jgi:hypothetical protein
VSFSGDSFFRGIKVITATLMKYLGRSKITVNQNSKSKSAGSK